MPSFHRRSQRSALKPSNVFPRSRYLGAVHSRQCRIEQPRLRVLISPRIVTRGVRFVRPCLSTQKMPKGVQDGSSSSRIDRHPSLSNKSTVCMSIYASLVRAFRRTPVCSLAPSRAGGKEQAPLSRRPGLISRLLVAARLAFGGGEACCRAKKDFTETLRRGSWSVPFFLRVGRRRQVPIFSRGVSWT